jgi:hypothetical protein
MSKQNPNRPHAARKIRDFSDRLLGAEIANGMYKKPIEQLAKEIHYDRSPMKCAL